MIAKFMVLRQPATGVTPYAHRGRSSPLAIPEISERRGCPRRFYSPVNYTTNRVRKPAGEHSKPARCDPRGSLRSPLGLRLLRRGELDHLDLPDGKLGFRIILFGAVVLERQVSLAEHVLLIHVIDGLLAVDEDLDVLAVGDHFLREPGVRRHEHLHD